MRPRLPATVQGVASAVTGSVPAFAAIDDAKFTRDVHAAVQVAVERFLDLIGTIWLDSSTYLARRIELQYVDGVELRGTVRVNFGDVAVAGGTLRMPVGGTFAMRPSRKNPSRRTEGKLAFTYTGFEEIPRR